MFNKITNANLKYELLEIQDKLDKLNTKSELKTELFEIRDKIDKLNTKNELKTELFEIHDKIDKLSTNFKLNTNNTNDTDDTNDKVTISELAFKLLIIEEKLEKLNVSIQKSKHEIEIDYNYIINEISKKLSEIYECNLENTNTIVNLFKTHTMTINDTINTKLNNEFINEITNIGRKYNEYEENNVMLRNIDEKINSIYFENELIKHQFVLEGEIRNAICEVDNLSNIITSAITQIDSLVKN
jgi:hypothetical protein